MPDATADGLAVSVAGHGDDEDYVMGGNAGQEYPEGDPLRSPLKNKLPVVGMGANVKIHVDDTLVRDAEGQTVSKGPMRGASSVGVFIDSQEVIVGTENLHEELSQEEHILEQQPEERKQIEDSTSDSANIVANAVALGTAPVRLAAPKQCARETVPELVGVQDSAMQMQEQEDVGLSKRPIDEVEPSIPGVTCLGKPANVHSPRGQHIGHVDVPAEGEATEAAGGTEAGDDEAGRAAGSVNPEPLQPEVVDADENASNAMAGYDLMEVDTAASEASGQAMPASLPAEHESMALDYGAVEHGEAQAARAETAETISNTISSTGHGNTTADLPPQRPSLADTDGWLRIGVPDHFKKARNQLHSMKSLAGMKLAPQSTPGRSRPATRSMSTRKQPKIKLNFTPKGKDQDGSKPGGPSSSAAAPQDTPRRSRMRDGGLYDGAVEEEPTSLVDGEEEVVLLTGPMDVDGAAAATTTVVDEKSGLPLSGAALALAIGNKTDAAAMAGPAAGRVTKSRGRDRGRGGRSGRGKGSRRRGR